MEAKKSSVFSELNCSDEEFIEGSIQDLEYHDFSFLLRIQIMINYFCNILGIKIK